MEQRAVEKLLIHQIEKMRMLYNHLNFCIHEVRNKRHQIWLKNRTYKGESENREIMFLHNDKNLLQHTLIDLNANLNEWRELNENVNIMEREGKLQY